MGSRNWLREIYRKPQSCIIKTHPHLGYPIPLSSSTAFVNTMASREEWILRGLFFLRRALRFQAALLKHNGLDIPSTIRELREHIGLDLMEAKKVNRDSGHGMMAGTMNGISSLRWDLRI